jgi:deazaflavin-dependent oxidoreductase (nitroreductase family)
MPIPRAVARFNRYVTNPIVRRFAGWAPGFCLLRHVGRRTGREYEIPLNVLEAEDGFVFALTYGSDADWVKNVLRAGTCSIRRHNKEMRLTNPRPVTTEEGMAHMTPLARPLLRLANVTEFLRMDEILRFRA